MKGYIPLLREAISIKSISTDPAFKESVKEMVDWLRHLLEENGCAVEVFEGYGNPIVYAAAEMDPSAETVLVYGHYDVQPAERSDGWESEPFELDERDGRYYGRGVVDNKGQVLIHIHSVLSLAEKEGLKYNVKFLIEGDEETGGLGVGELLRSDPEKFKADHVLISDGEMPYKPVLTASFRGTFNVTLKYRTATNSLHSGLYGGTVPNAAEELATFVSCLHDKDHGSQIKDFYKDDEKPGAKESKLCSEMDDSKKEILEKIGVKELFLGDSGSFTEKVGFHSMCTVSGMQSGYTGSGYSNIIPDTAEVRLNFRLAAWQKPESALERFEAFVAENTPKYVEYEIADIEAQVEPVKVDLSSRKHQEVMGLLKDIYEEDVLVDYCGATIPVVADFQQVLGVDPLLVSLANDDCNMHGVNENFDVSLVKKGLAFSKAFFGK